jgi:hypothetical protein
MMGHNDVAIPSKASTLPSGETAPRESRGGNGARHPWPGAVERGAVPNDRAAITS